MRISLAHLDMLDHAGDGVSFSDIWRIWLILPPQPDHRDTPRLGNTGGDRGASGLDQRCPL